LPSTRSLGHSFRVRRLKGRRSIGATGKELGKPFPAFLTAPEGVEHPVLPSLGRPLVDRKHSPYGIEPQVGAQDLHGNSHLAVDHR
jgi:hypothetical protein